MMAGPKAVDVLAKRTLIWLWLVITISPGQASADQVKIFGKFTIGQWSGSAFSDGKGEFNHCSVSVFMRDDTLIAFSVGRTFTWSVAFYKKNWKISPAEPLPVMMGVDDMAPLQIDARVIDGNKVEIGLGEDAELFMRFGTGRRLKVLGMPKPIDFNLSGVDRVLPRLFACALTEGNRKVPTFVRDPAADIPNYTARQMRSESAIVVEATTFAANLLSASGITGYRMLGPKEEPRIKGDARWIMPAKGIGVIEVNPDMTLGARRSFGRALIAGVAKSCKGSFLSSALPDDERTGSARVFTVCQTGKAILLSYYFTIPRPAGGAYLVATIHSETPHTAPRARETDTRFRNAGYMMGAR